MAVVQHPSMHPDVDAYKTMRNAREIVATSVMERVPCADSEVRRVAGTERAFVNVGMKCVRIRASLAEDVQFCERARLGLLLEGQPVEGAEGVQIHNKKPTLVLRSARWVSVPPSDPRFADQCDISCVGHAGYSNMLDLPGYSASGSEARSAMRMSPVRSCSVPRAMAAAKRRFQVQF